MAMAPNPIAQPVSATLEKEVSTVRRPTLPTATAITPIAISPTPTATPPPRFAGSGCATSPTPRNARTTPTAPRASRSAPPIHAAATAAVAMGTRL